MSNCLGVLAYLDAITMLDVLVNLYLQDTDSERAVRTWGEVSGCDVGRGSWMPGPADSRSCRGLLRLRVPGAVEIESAGGDSLGVFRGRAHLCRAPIMLIDFTIARAAYEKVLVVKLRSQ